MLQPLPEKHSLRRLDRFSAEFLRIRGLALQKFLSRVADHPVQSFDKNFHIFLTAKAWVKEIILLLVSLVYIYFFIFRYFLKGDIFYRILDNSTIESLNLCSEQKLFADEKMFAENYIQGLCIYQ